MDLQENVQKDGIIHNTLKHKSLLFMALPAVILVIMFSYLPMFGLIIAFKEYNFTDGIFGSQWVGLRNFGFLVTSKDVMWSITRNTILYWLLFTVVGTFMNVSLAILINECKNKLFAKISHTIMIFPTFISWIAVTYIVKALLDGDNGMINHLLAMMGKEPIEWYAEPSKWPVILLITNIWKGMGYGAIIYLSTLVGLDNDLFEAANLDGASKMQQIWYITLPLLLPTVIIMTLLSIGSIMYSNTGLFYQVTKNIGILYPTTQTIDSYLLNAIAKGANDFGITSSVAFFQSIIGCIMVIVTNFIVRKWEADNALF